MAGVVAAGEEDLVEVGAEEDLAEEEDLVEEDLAVAGAAEDLAAAGEEEVEDARGAVNTAVVGVVE